MHDPSTRNRSEYTDDLAICDGLPKHTMDLETAVDVYLKALRQKAGDTTYHSHQTTLATYIDWFRESKCTNTCLDEEIVAQFTTELLTRTSHSLSTVSGYVCTLANFFAYLKQRDPELVKANIIAEFNSDDSPRLEAVISRVFREVQRDCGPSGAPRSAVKALASYLRQRQFGTRTHVFVEVLLDTKSRPAPIQQLNLCDIIYENNSLRVNVPDTNIVKSVGLVTDRVAPLTVQTIDALNAYINYERKTGSHDELSPLFTTSHGRASYSTLCRSVKQASEATATYFSSKTTTPETQPGTLVSDDLVQVVTPSDIWWYTISTIIERE